MRAHEKLDLSTLSETILKAFPDTEAIYLFGSYATGEHRTESDLDLAVLLPYLTARRAGSLYLSPLHTALCQQAPADVDLVNMRLVSTVFQMEIINTGRRIYCINKAFCTDYEALTLSLYQKLNEERAEIIHQIYATGRVYAP